IGGTGGTSCVFPGGRGGDAQGGGLYATGGFLIFADSTVADNTLRGGDGGHSRCNTGGDGGTSEGSGLWLATGMAAQISLSTISSNQATGGIHGMGSTGSGQDGSATGAGLDNQGVLQTCDTILAGNTVNGPGTNSAPDLAGNLGSLGYNLI